MRSSLERNAHDGEVRCDVPQLPAASLQPSIPATFPLEIVYGGPAPHPEKSPRPHAGGSCSRSRCSLPADLDGGSTTKAEGAAVRGDHLDPQCILVLEVRGVAGFAQRIQAGLLRTRGCGVEARQLEDHPRAFVQLRHPEGDGRSLGGHLDLGTGSYVGAGQGVVLAIAAENHWRFSRRTAGTTTRPATTGTCASATTTRRTAATATRALAKTGHRPSSRTGTRCAPRAPTR